MSLVAVFQSVCVSAEWLGHRTYSCYFAGGVRTPRYVGREGIVYGSCLTSLCWESFLRVCSILLPDVMVLTTQNTFWGKSKMSPGVSVWPWKSFYLLKSTGAWTFMWTLCVWFRLFWGIPHLASNILLEVMALSLPARNMYPHNYLPETWRV